MKLPKNKSQKDIGCLIGDFSDIKDNRKRSGSGDTIEMKNRVISENFDYESVDSKGSIHSKAS